MDPEVIQGVLGLIITLICLLAVGVVSGLIFVKLLKKSVLGGLWGAWIVGVLGAVLGGFLLRDWFQFIITLLMKNGINVDFLSSFIGAFVMIVILSKLSHK